MHQAMAIADAASLGDFARRSMPPVIAIVGLLVGGQILAGTGFARGHLLPGPVEIVAGIIRDWHLYPLNIAATGSVAIRGFLFGNLIAVALAFACILVPRSEKPIMQIALVAYAVPILAVA